jgi:hypothetical protein
MSLTLHHFFGPAPLLGVMIAFHVSILPCLAAHGVGYLRVSGPAPIRFLPATPQLAQGPEPCPAPTSHSPLASIAPIDKLPISESPAPSESAMAELPLPASPEVEPDNFGAPLSPPDFAPAQSGHAGNFNAASTPLTSLIPTEITSAIAPQAVLSLFFDPAMDRATNAVVAATFSFVPPQPTLQPRSSATYTVTP